MNWLWIQRATLPVLCVALAMIAGCGGGGGSEGGDVPVDPPPTGSGLLPEPLAIGATLHEDGVALLGLRDGAVMSFRGIGPDRLTPYENVVTHTATVGGFTERHTNAFNAGATEASELQVAGGTVSETVSFQIAPGSPAELISFVEIRSPVRVNDRYVHLDRHYGDGGIDADGDGKNDALDVVAWSQVMGNEVIESHQRGPMTAVRVDDRVRLRFRFSSNNQYGEVVEFRASKWLAKGHGAIKRFSDTPIDAYNREVYTEELINRDAVDSGIGYTAGQAQLAPSGSNVAGEALPAPNEVAAFSGHAVVMSRWRLRRGMVLSQLDVRGQAVASAFYPDASLLSDSFGEAHMARVGEELRVVFSTNAGLKLLGFNGTGQKLTRGTPVVVTTDLLTLGFETDSFAVQGTADSLWVAWLTAPRESNVKVRIRRFDAQGRPQTPVITVDTNIFAGSVSGLRMKTSATGDAVVVLAAENSAGKRWQYAAVSPSGQLLANQAVGVPCVGSFVPQALDSGVTLTCTDKPYAGAVTLDESMKPRLGSNGGVQVDGGLPAWWIQNQGAFYDLTGTGDGLALTGGQYRKLWPDDRFESEFTQIGLMPLAGGVLRGEQLQVLAKVPWNEFSAVLTVPFADRLLLVGADCACESAKLRTMVVWKP